MSSYEKLKKINEIYLVSHQNIYQLTNAYINHSVRQLVGKGVDYKAN